MRSSEPFFSLATYNEDGLQVICPRGEVDLAVADTLKGAIEAAGGTKVVVDLSGLTFIDSSGLRALLIGKRRVEEQGRQFEVRGVRQEVRRVFEIAGLADTFFRREPDVSTS